MPSISGNPTRGKPDILGFTPMTDQLIQFEYENWRGEQHEYVIEPESVVLGLYDAGGSHRDSPNREDNLQLVLHGMIVTRDGDTRPHLGSRRRTFLIRKMRAIRVLERST